jgi:hypothetical protein
LRFKIGPSDGDHALQLPDPKPTAHVILARELPMGAHGNDQDIAKSPSPARNRAASGKIHDRDLRRDWRTTNPARRSAGSDQFKS